jgi:hypothetical protein
VSQVLVLKKKDMSAGLAAKGGGYEGFNYFLFSLSYRFQNQPEVFVSIINAELLSLAYLILLWTQINSLTRPVG